MKKPRGENSACGTCKIVFRREYSTSSTLSKVVVGMVQLLEEDGTVVGFGVLDTNFTCVIELHQVKLRPFEVTICVTHTFNERK